MGAALEFELRVNNSFAVGQDDSRGVQGGGGAVNFRDRRAEVWIDSVDLGRLWLGKGWTASEGSSERDLSDTWIAGYSDPRVMGGGMRFRDSQGIEDNPRVFEVFDNMDGLGRDVRLRYDTPSRGIPIQLRLSTAQGGVFDGALFYDFRGARARWAAAVSYADVRRSGTSTFGDLVNGSFSVLSGSGLSLTVAGGVKRAFRNEPERSASFAYGKIGYQRDLWRIGRTAVSMDYQETRDLMRRDDRALAMGMQFVQHLSRWGAELYLNLRRHELHRPGARFEPMSAGMAGLRVRF